MNYPAHIFTIVFMVILMLCRPIHAHPEDDSSKTRAIYLTNYSSIFANTTNKNVLVYTKKNPFESRSDDSIDASLYLLSKIAKESWVVLVLHSEENGQRKYIGEFHLRGFDLKDFEGEGKTAKTYPFSISKKYFDAAILRISTEEEEFELHLHKNIKAEQGDADEPATAPQLKSSGNENPNPESKPRPQ